MLRFTVSSCQVKDGVLGKVGRLENQNKSFLRKEEILFSKTNILA